MFVLYVVIAAVFFYLDWCIANHFFEVAQMKGFRERKYLWICFLLGMVGYLLVIALPDRGNTQQAISDELPEL